MAKSRGRKFAELVAPTNGVFAAASIPTIALSKLASSTVTINSESLSLGGSLTLDTSDIGEHTSNKYFTDTRAQASLSVASNSGHGALAYDSSNGQFTFAGITTEAIQDVVGAMFSSNTETAVTVTYQDSDGTIDLVVDDTTKVPLAGGTMTGNLTLGDNVNAYFGASTDLRIYHDGTNSHIINSTGELRFTGSNFAIKSDSAKLYFGAGDDLQIYHDGTHSRIKNNQGQLWLQSDTGIRFTDSGVNEAMAAFYDNGAVELYYDGTKKFETTSGGINVTGSVVADGVSIDDDQNLALGSSDEFKLYHTSSGNSVISETGGGSLYLDGTNIYLRNGTATGEAMADFVSDGAVTLYHNNVAKLATTSTGVQTTGTLNVNGAFSFPTSDGTNGQVLQTNGSGVVSWSTAAGGGSVFSTSGSDAYYSAGNVGIGSSTVSHPLTVQDGANMTMLLNRTASNEPANLNEFSSYYSLGIVNRNAGSYLNFGGGSAGTKIQATDGAGSATAKYITLNPYGGYVGIGTGNTAPASILHIEGNTNAYTTSPLLYFGSTSTANAGVRDWAIGPADSAYGNFHIFRGASTGANPIGNAGTVFTIDNAGQVGLGKVGYFAPQAALHINSGATNQKILLSGSSDPYIRWQENTTDKAFIQWNAAGYLEIKNQEDASGIRVKDSPDFSLDGSTYHTIWHAGNDGTGSGLDADLLDGLSSEDFARLGSSYSSAFTGTPSSSNLIRFDNASGQSMNSSSTYLSRLECRQATAGADAFMTFHVAGDYAAYFGLDGASNDFAVGGWSMGANKYKVWHSGNDGSGSGLDADTLDGLQGSSYMGYLGMATNRDDYINLRVIRNSGSSAGSNGMYIGYGNAGSGVTRLYGGGQTSNHMAVNASSVTFTGLSLGAVSMGGTLTSQDVLVSSGYHLQRSNHHTGYLEGSYNNVGANSAKSNPIYSIGSAYTPGDASTGNMYGVGYSHHNFWGTANGRSSNWGFYAVDNGTVFFTTTSQRTWSSAEFNRNGNTVWDAGNDGSGSGLDADMVDGYHHGSFMKSGAGDSVSGWWINGARNASGTSPRVYFSHSGGYGMHINTYNTSGSVYAMELHNNSTELLKVMNDGQVRIPGQLRIGAGSNDGYFYSDSNGRTAFAGGDFYIQNSVSNYYNYATNQYLGDNSGDNIYLRGNTMSGNSWSLTGSGLFRTANGLTAGSTSGLTNQSALLALAGTSPYISFHHGGGARTGYIQEASNRLYFGEFTYTEDPSSFRSPIFYDSNDTAYYADIAGTSRYNYIRPNDISCVGNVDYGNPRWDFRAHVVESPHHYATTATQTMYIGEDNTINLRDHAIAEDDCRAPIFYHSTNTTYYVRPGSSSKFAGDIFIDGNYGVGIVGVYASTRYQHVWMMGSAYRTNAAGTSYGNAYGLTWTHTNVGTGTNQSISGLSHQLQVRANGTLWCAMGQGIWTTGNVTAYSDIAVKTNLEVIPNALEKVCSISGYTYDRTDFVPDPETGEMPETRQAGVVAQEVEKVLPEVVSGEEGNKNVAYGNMVSILIEAIKELKTEVDELKAQLNKEK